MTASVSDESSVLSGNGARHLVISRCLRTKDRFRLIRSFRRRSARVISAWVEGLRRNGVASSLLAPCDSSSGASKLLARRHINSAPALRSIFDCVFGEVARYAVSDRGTEKTRAPHER